MTFLCVHHTSQLFLSMHQILVPINSWKWTRTQNNWQSTDIWQHYQTRQWTSYPTGNWALLDCIIATMIPKMPSAEAKISTIKILTKRESSWASLKAHELPAIPVQNEKNDIKFEEEKKIKKRLNNGLPTAIPLAMFVKPTLQPDQNTLYPAK